MSYVICNEVGNLTLFHYFLDADGHFYCSTNNAMNFATKDAAIRYARDIKARRPELHLYVLGPRKGRTFVKKGRVMV